LISTDDFLKDFQILPTAPIKCLHHKFIIKKNFILFILTLVTIFWVGRTPTCYWQISNWTRSLTPTSFTIISRFWALELFVSGIYCYWVTLWIWTLDSRLGYRNLSILNCGNVPIVWTAARSNCVVYKLWFFVSW